GEGTAQLGIVLAGCLLNVGAGCEWSRFPGGDGVRGARIGEEEDAELETRFFGGQSRIGKFALALLQLQLCLYHIGMGGFALLFTLVGKRRKVSSLRVGLLCDSQ